MVRNPHNKEMGVKEFFPRVGRTRDRVACRFSAGRSLRDAVNDYSITLWGKCVSERYPQLRDLKWTIPRLSVFERDFCAQRRSRPEDLSERHRTTSLCGSTGAEKRMEQIRTGDASRVLHPMSERTRRDACGKAKAGTIGRAEICRLPSFFSPLFTAAIVSCSGRSYFFFAYPDPRPFVFPIEY